MCIEHPAFEESGLSLRTPRSGDSISLHQSAIIGVVMTLVLVIAGRMADAQQEQTPARSESADTTADPNKREGNAAANKKSAKTGAKSETVDRESAVVMQFADENHPELARLLEQLKKSRPGEFTRAVRELGQEIRTLDRIRERNPGKYQAQLDSWKRDSQIRVLMARWSRSQDPDLEKQVRELLTVRREARLLQLKSEKERLAEQLKRVEEQLVVASQPIPAEVEKEWEQLSKKASIKKLNDRKSTRSAASASGTGPAGAGKEP